MNKCKKIEGKKTWQIKLETYWPWNKTINELEKNDKESIGKESKFIWGSRICLKKMDKLQGNNCKKHEDGCWQLITHMKKKKKIAMKQGCKRCKRNEDTKCKLKM
jgi:hypothetical protein